MSQTTPDTSVSTPAPRSGHRSLRDRLTVRRPGSFDVLAGGLGLLFILLLGFPIANLLINVVFADGQFRGGDAIEVLTRDGLATIVADTLIVVATAGSLAVLLGTVIAWLTERTDARWGWASGILPIIPLMLPPIALAIGWYFLAESGTGFLNAAFRSVFGGSGEGPLNINSWPGLVWVYTLYLVPYAYLTMSTAFRNLDPALEEASKVSGASVWRTFWRISIPAVRPAIGSSVLLVAIAGIAVFSIPTIIGTNAKIEVLSVHIVRVIRFSYPPKLFDGAVLSVLMMLIVAAAWLLQRRLSAKQRFAVIAGKAGGTSVVRLGRLRWVARGFILFFLALSSVVPLTALIIVSLQSYWAPTVNFGALGLDNFRQFFSGGSGAIDSLRTSVQLGVVGATVAIAMSALMMVYVTSRRGGTTGRAIDFSTKAPGAISHIIIGVAFLLAFSGPPFSLYGTITILLLAYITMYMPQASVSTGDAIQRVGGDLTEASLVSGATPWSTFRRVTLPLIAPGVAAGWCILFVLMVGDLTASALLSSTSAPVVGFTILEIWENGVITQLAALVVVICAVSTVVVGTMLWITGRGSRRTKR